MKRFSEEDRENVRSFVKASDPTIVRHCEECGEECKEGQPLWNGWFAYEGLYHFQCVPEDLKIKFGLIK